MTTGTKLANKSDIFTLADYVLAHNAQGLGRLDVVLVLHDFSEKFDLSAMARFLKFALENEMNEHEIIATIAHDLNGRNDICFDPRTSSY